MVVGAFLAKPCPCHNKAAKDDDDDDNEYQESIKPIIEKFYYVKYDFLDVKGNITAKVLPAICSQNDLEERFFAFMKTVRKNKCTPVLILPIKPVFIKMLCNCQLFQISPGKENTNGNNNNCKKGKQYVSTKKDFPED